MFSRQFFQGFVPRQFSRQSDAAFRASLEAGLVVAHLADDVTLLALKDLQAMTKHNFSTLAKCSKLWKSN
jgi:hypothetical protein